MNVRDIAQAIESHVHVHEGTYYSGEAYRYEESGWYQWSEIGDIRDADPVIVEGVGSVEVVHAETGGEGAAEHCELIFKVTADDGTVRYFEKDGWYQSFNGTEWDGDFYEVEPAQKTITVYSKIKN
jgi:uncharacterized protein YndB with AHSA1/START domain